jgi:hypothetical protein
MRTSGRRIKSGERSRSECDRCGALWDRDKLWRDREGLLNCPLEGKGRDAVELTEANLASAKAYADAKRPMPHDPGRYDKTPATPIGQRTGNILDEDGTPITGEDGVYLLQG